jgi:hypothetical protein
MLLTRLLVQHVAGHVDVDGMDTRVAPADLVVWRHVSQAVPDFPQVLAEITRVLKPGGWLHLLSEDYGMLHIRNTRCGTCPSPRAASRSEESCPSRRDGHPAVGEMWR